jgi:hypothetical protein
MARLAPAPVHLSDSERADLHSLLNRHSTGQQIVLRGRMILLADAGKNHREIDRELNISRDMARLWRPPPRPLRSNKPCNCLRWPVATQKLVDVPSVIGPRENSRMSWCNAGLSKASPPAMSDVC